MNTLSSLLYFIGDYIFNKTVLQYYPVGSYYETSDASFDPNVSWGGTWVLETAGKVHIGAGTGYTIGSTGGAETVTLTSAQMPSHTHAFTGTSHKHYTAGAANRYVPYDNNGTRSTPAGAHGQEAWYPGVNNTNTWKWGTETNGVAAGGTNASTGGGAAHNNMQPYIVVNRWHRTA